MKSTSKRIKHKDEKMRRECKHTPSADAFNGWLSFTWWAASLVGEGEEAKIADICETTKGFDETKGTQDFKLWLVEIPIAKAMTFVLFSLLSYLHSTVPIYIQFSQLFQALDTKKVAYLSPLYGILQSPNDYLTCGKRKEKKVISFPTRQKKYYVQISTKSLKLDTYILIF